MRLSLVRAASRRVPNYHNMPARFIERHTTMLCHRAPRLPQYTRKIFRYKINPYYDEWRPWDDNFAKLNQQNLKVPKVFVEPLRHNNYFRGDRVEVLKGKDIGKQGNVIYIVKERNWIFVQGLNLRREMNMDGFITCHEEPYLMNIEAKLVDPSDLAPTDVEWKYDDDGNEVRVSTRTGRIIPMPAQAYETIDYIEQDKYLEQPKDTPAKDVLDKTFQPKSKTFEMDICDEYQIKDDRVPYPMYWY